MCLLGTARDRDEYRLKRYDISGFRFSLAIFALSVSFQSQVEMCWTKMPDLKECGYCTGIRLPVDII